MSQYIKPTSTVPIPGKLSFNQFIQTVLVGISGLSGFMVRPDWQAEPPKHPDILTNWIAFGLNSAAPDANLWIGVDEDDVTNTQRNQTLEVALSIYGPDFYETYGLLQDGFQIPNNLEGLRSANIGFVEITPAIVAPDLINERWVKRITTSIILRRGIQRVYPILTLLSANGSIHTVVGNEEYLVPWEA